MSETTKGNTLSRFGVWAYPSTVTAESVNELEQLGYSAIWVADPDAELDVVARLLAATERIVIGSYIVNVWTTPAERAAEAFHRIDAAFPGRFLLGIGAGHREINHDYAQPFQAVADYLDELDDLKVPRQRRAVGALGPRMLGLARDRAASALPFMITPNYIGGARTLLGSKALLVAEHRVVLAEDPQKSRALGRDEVGKYLRLSNVRASLRRIGFRDDDMSPSASDRLVDALVAHGAVASVAARLHDFLDAGADQVLVHALGADNDLMPALRALAGWLSQTTQQSVRS